MFTNDDYKKYFSELETIFKKSLTIYTDLLNEISDQSLRSKLYAVTMENTEAYKKIKEYKKKFSQD